MKYYDSILRLCIHSSENSNYGGKETHENSIQFLFKTTEIIQGILKYQCMLPWKTPLDDMKISTMVGDNLILYLVGSMDIERLVEQKNLYSIVRPLLEYYFSLTDLEFMIADQDDLDSECILSKEELDTYIGISIILDYPNDLILKIASMRENAPKTVREAEILQEIRSTARNSAMRFIAQVQSGKSIHR